MKKRQRKKEYKKLQFLFMIVGPAYLNAGTEFKVLRYDYFKQYPKKLFRKIITCT